MPKLESGTTRFTNAIVSLWRWSEDSAVVNVTMIKNSHSISLWMSKSELEELGMSLVEFSHIVLEKKEHM